MASSQVQSWSWCPVHGPPGPGGSCRATGAAAAPHLFMWGTKCLCYPTTVHKLQPLNKKLTPQHRLSRGFAVNPWVQRGEQENLGETRAHTLLSNKPA